MPSQYCKKPAIIEAHQWTGTLTPSLTEWLQCSFSTIRNNDLLIETPEGDMIASPNDYIIKGVQGEFYPYMSDTIRGIQGGFYPCKPDIFHDTYEKVSTQ